LAKVFGGEHRQQPQFWAKSTDTGLRAPDCLPEWRPDASIQNNSDLSQGRKHAIGGTVEAPSTLLELSGISAVFLMGRKYMS
jgi:hypothetical protein